MSTTQTPNQTARAAAPRPVAPAAAEPVDHKIGPRSMMRIAGRFGFLFSLVIAVYTMMNSSSVGGTAVGYLASSAAGAFALMWMLGAIETRLIMLNDTLSRATRR